MVGLRCYIEKRKAIRCLIQVEVNDRPLRSMFDETLHPKMILVSVHVLFMHILIFIFLYHYFTSF